MNGFGAELTTFFISICKSWISLMSGIFGLIAWALGAALEPMPVSLRWTFIAFGTLSLLVCCFLTWRRAYQEARPYDKETFRHYQAVFAALTDEEKTALEQLAIRKNMANSELPASLEQTGFIQCEPVHARCALRPEFEKMAPRLVKEWRARKRLAE